MQSWPKFSAWAVLDSSVIQYLYMQCNYSEPCLCLPKLHKQSLSVTTCMNPPHKKENCTLCILPTIYKLIWTDEFYFCLGIRKNKKQTEFHNFFMFPFHIFINLIDTSLKTHKCKHLLFIFITVYFVSLTDYEILVSKFMGHPSTNTDNSKLFLLLWDKWKTKLSTYYWQPCG